MTSFLDDDCLLGALLDDSDGNGLLHISHSESSERGILGEGLAAQGLGGLQDNHSSITVLDSLGLLLNSLSGSPVNLRLDFVELAGNVSSVTIQDGGINRSQWFRGGS